MQVSTLSQQRVVSKARCLRKPYHQRLCVRVDSYKDPRGARGDPNATPQLPKLTPAQTRDPLYYPSAKAEEDMSHKAFASAYEAAKPKKLRVKGLQELCAALWQRRRDIPSGYGDALLHEFNLIDRNNDGVLSAEEIAELFTSLQVKVSAEQIEALLEDFTGMPSAACLKKEQWPEFVYSLAISDLHARSPGSKSTGSDSSQDLP